MRLVCTGGAGFIGSHVADALIDRGHRVLVLDDLSSGKRENVPARAELAVCSVTSPEAERLIAAFRPDALVHHAAQMDVRVSVAKPLFDAEVNVAGTLRVASAAVAAGARTLLLASTGGAIYGEQDVFPAPETHARRPTSPYGVSKLCAEEYLDYLARSAGVRAVHLRYANVYGPRQNPHGEAGVVAIFLGKMLAGETPVIYGDGRQTRDYVYVGDVVRANLAALEDERAHGPYNVGTGVETDVHQLIGGLARAIGWRGEPGRGAARAGEQRRSVLDCSRALRELGWKPEVRLDEGLARTAAHFRERTAVPA
jgi:UDP-glucose 4-epimerase